MIAPYTIVKTPTGETKHAGSVGDVFEPGVLTVTDAIGIGRVVRAYRSGEWLEAATFDASDHLTYTHRNTPAAARGPERPPNYRPERTPIIADMQQTARDLLIVSMLLEHQRILYDYPGHAYDLVEEVLIRLGCSNAELVANLDVRKAIHHDA